MHDYLVTHALRNVWCNPNMDKQQVVIPSRVSPYAGFLNQGILMDSLLKMPVSQRRVHVFQVGQMDPKLLGLLRQVPNWTTQRWFKFSDAVKANALEVTIYNAAGVNLPRTDCYYMYTDERAVVFAVPENRKIPVNPGKEQIFFRFYSNTYYDVTSAEARSMDTGSVQFVTTDDILAFEPVLANLRTRPGQVRVYLNGFLADNAGLGNAKPGDFVEWVHDQSVKRVIEYKLADIQQFRSTMDNVYKYLLHNTGSQDQVIDYQDDIDVHVVFRRPAVHSRGVYYNRNKEVHHRQITHRDYSIVAGVVGTLAYDLANLQGLPTPTQDQIFVQVTVRHGGYNRPLIYEHHRIFELYKLEEPNISRALTGLDANVPEWFAANLEESGYNKIMGAQHRDVDIPMVQSAYGYNASSKYLADTPTKLSSATGSKVARLPHGLQRKATIYEFDYQGLMLGWYESDNDIDYEARNNNAYMVEGLVGKPSIGADCIYGQTDIVVPTDCFSYRVYRCFMQQGIPDLNWEDITDTEDYAIEDGKLVWKAGGNDHWLMLRTDKNIIAYDFEHQADNGLLNFNLMESLTGNPDDPKEIMKIPMAMLDLWMNDRHLVKGVDYIVDFPQVFIINVTYLNQPASSATQKFHVRMAGLPDSNMQLEPIEDRGWVLNGTISGNKRYDVRDDRVMQISAGGRLFHRDDVLLAEDRPGHYLVHAMNGQPYEIKDVIVPMRGHTQMETYRLRKLSKAVDKRVSDYMTEKFGPMESEELSAIPQRYPVVSPFLSHITHLLSIDALGLPSDRYLTDIEVFDRCRPYEELLKFDTLSADHSLNDKFAYVIPHANASPVEVDVIRYRFMEQVLRLYTQDTVILSGYMTVTQQ